MAKILWREERERTKLGSNISTNDKGKGEVTLVPSFHSFLKITLMNETN